MQKGPTKSLNYLFLLIFEPSYPTYGYGKVTNDNFVLQVEMLSLTITYRRTNTTFSEHLHKVKN